VANLTVASRELLEAAKLDTSPSFGDGEDEAEVATNSRLLFLFFGLDESPSSFFTFLLYICIRIFSSSVIDSPASAHLVVKYDHSSDVPADDTVGLVTF